MFLSSALLGWMPALAAGVTASAASATAARDVIHQHHHRHMAPADRDHRSEEPGRSADDSTLPHAPGCPACLAMQPNLAGLAMRPAPPVHDDWSPSGLAGNDLLPPTPPPRA